MSKKPHVGKPWTPRPIYFNKVKPGEIIPGSVLICTLRPEMVTSGYAQCLAMLCLENPYNAIIGYHGARTARSALGRQKIIEEGFLPSPAEYLLWVDSDMVFTPQTFSIIYEEMLRLRHEGVQCGITNALAFMYSDSEQKVLPNCFFRNPQTGLHEVRAGYPPDSRFWCDATGVAFTLIHREVFDAVGPPYHQDWVHHPDTQVQMGHDVHFFYEASKHGYRVRYCADAKTGHMKMFPVDESMWLNYLSQVQARMAELKSEDVVEAEVVEDAPTS